MLLVSGYRHQRTHCRGERAAKPAQRPVRPHPRGTSEGGRIDVADGGQGRGKVWRWREEGVSMNSAGNALKLDLTPRLDLLISR